MLSQIWPYHLSCALCNRKTRVEPHRIGCSPTHTSEIKYNVITLTKYFPSSLRQFLAIELPLVQRRVASSRIPLDFMNVVSLNFIIVVNISAFTTYFVFRLLLYCSLRAGWPNNTKLYLFFTTLHTLQQILLSFGFSTYPLDKGNLNTKLKGFLSKINVYTIYNSLLYYSDTQFSRETMEIYYKYNMRKSHMNKLLNPDIGKRVFGYSPHLYGLRLINYRVI